MSADWSDQLTLFVAVSPASPSLSLVSASDGTTSEGTSSGTPSSSRTTSKRGTSSSKTSPESLQSIREGLSGRSSFHWGKQGFITSSGVCLIHSGSESPSAGDVFSSSLAGILESSVDVKYSLSAKACAGILRRAGKRGRKLRSPLQAALEGVVSRQPSTVEETAEGSEPNRESIS